MTDIWRGYIAQKIIYEKKHQIVFEKPLVFQRRNSHKISSDFFSEHLGYIQSKNIIEELKRIKLDKVNKLTDCLLVVYEKLVHLGVFKSNEIFYLKRWVSEFES